MVLINCIVVSRPLCGFQTMGQEGRFLILGALGRSKVIFNPDPTAF